MKILDRHPRVVQQDLFTKQKQHKQQPLALTDQDSCYYQNKASQQFIAQPYRLVLEISL